MAESFDQIVIAVPDLSVAAAEYQTLLGQTAVKREGDGREGEACFALSNTAVTLRQGESDRARVTGIVLRDTAAGKAVEAVANPLGLSVGRCDGSASDALAGRLADVAVDHLVLRTHDAEACIAFFSGDMGIRLALDKTVPEWGGRMLFFRAGKMTLEVIESDKAADSRSIFWGIAYQHADIDALASALGERNVALSEIRDGRKPGTRVATLKSHDLGIPTLLIQPANQDQRR